MKEAATLAATDTVIIDTIEIAHPDIDSIYLANDRVELTAATGPADGVLSLPGIGGNYASIDAADITLPTDFLDARIVFGEAYLSNPNFDSEVIPLAHHSIVTGSTIYQAWNLKVQSDGKLQMPVWDNSNVQSNFSSTASIPTDADGIRSVVRGTDDIDPSKASVQFFYSTDSGATWVELDNRVYAATAAVITSIKQATGPITIGERLDNTPNPFHGTIKFVELYGAVSEADLRLRVDFRPLANASGSFTNAEGVPVTIANPSQFTGGGAGVTYAGGASLTNPGTVNSLFDSDGVAGSYGSIAYEPAVNGLSDFTFQVDDITDADWSSPGGYLFSQWQQAWGYANERNFYVYVHYTGGIGITLQDDATGSARNYISTATVSVNQGASASIRVTRTGSDMNFFVDYGAGVGFVQLGATVTGAHTTVLPSHTTDYKVGAFNVNGDQPFEGTIGRCRIWSDATQTTNVFDLNFASVAVVGEAGKIVRSNSVSYEPVGFKFKLPSVTGNGVQDLSLEFSNVDRRVNDFIESVEASLDPVTVTHRVYLSGGDLNSVPESDPPLKLTLSDIEISAFKVRARASFVNIVNKQYPTEYYDRDRFPSI